MIAFNIKGKLEHATTFLNNLKVIWLKVFIYSGLFDFAFNKQVAGL